MSREQDADSIEDPSRELESKPKDRAKGEPRVTDQLEHRLRHWRARTTAGTKIYKEWDDVYHSAGLEEMYLGHQWDADEARTLGFDPDAMQLYTMNLFFPAIEARRPSLIFEAPRVRVTPKSTRSDDPLSTIGPRCELLADTANTYISDPSKNFKRIADLCVQESLFRFGVMEVGYENSAEDNPRAGQPMLDSDSRELLASDGSPIYEPAKRITAENFWFRRIPASQFRVSAPDKNLLHEHDWVGYYEWVKPADLKLHPLYENASHVEADGSYARSSSFDSDSKVEDSVAGSDDNSASTVDRRKGCVKIWKVWDLRKKVRHVFPDTGDFFLLVDHPFKTLPFAVLKFHEILDRFYPLPPTYNWISPQKEYNEVREMQRVHRKRFYRRYLVKEGAFASDDELVKIETGGDGSYAKVSQGSLLEAIQPVPDAPLDRAIANLMPATKEDFTQMTGVSSEQRMVGSSSTATQAKIMEVNSRIRGDVMRELVASFLSEAVTILLKLIVEHATLPLLIRTHVDPTSMGAAREAQSIAATWQLVQSEHLTGIDFEWDAQVDVESIAPPSEDSDRETWDRVLQILSNPGLAIPLALSDTLLRKTLRRYGITSVSEIEEVKRVMFTLYGSQLQMLMMGAPPALPSPGQESGPGMSSGSLPAAQAGVAPGKPATPGAPDRGGHDESQQIQAQMQIPGAGAPAPSTGGIR